jgi:hypothetical protein
VPSLPPSSTSRDRTRRHDGGNWPRQGPDCARDHLSDPSRDLRVTEGTRTPPFGTTI